MSAITHLVAGVPVSDLDAGTAWYTRLLGRPPDHRVGTEMLWEIDEHGGAQRELVGEVITDGLRQQS